MLTDPFTFQSFQWRTDADGYLLSPLGTKVAKIEGTVLMLYDKHAKTDFPLTMADFTRLVGHRRPQEEKQADD